jgi:hypothetical protein
LNTFFNFFTQEYSFLVKNFPFNFKKSLLLGVFFIIYLFLIISGETISFPTVILVYSCFGFIVFASFLFSFYYLPKYFFPKLYKSLSLIKYIFWFAITMLFGTILSYFFHCFVYKNSIDYFGFILYVKYISVLLFPILFLIRSKIKTIENDLHNHFLVKTHRSYLCNLKNVSRVSKTQNNYFLHFDMYNIKIPVSSLNTEHVFNELNRKN